eukprot:gene22861-64940_t
MMVEVLNGVIISPPFFRSCHRTLNARARADALAIWAEEDVPGSN